MIPISLRRAQIVLAAALLAGCATGPGASRNDPIEPFNRVVFGANDALDRYVAVPVAKGYRAVTPGFARTGVSNFFANLGDVGNTINNLLQGKLHDGAESLSRLVVNTIFGIGGLFDVATPTGLDKHSQDFGLTLGTWGLASGPYLVLPLFGPSSIRDGVGQVADIQLDPIRYTDPAVRDPLYVASVINTRANLLGATDLLDAAALDRYTFVRDAYLQQRRYRIDQNRGTTTLPDYEDSDDAAPPGVKAPERGGR
ncbi:VacJ family lipoprotein [Rugamonas sp.]|uniref:MlaA family lipoprotein n=1 Tax=Rugamonas sp. TaxID=1926287 RepID=UPI0025E8FAE1|nr:VacJ family lipoprotein [Rugamonas sp.]